MVNTTLQRYLFIHLILWCIYFSEKNFSNSKIFTSLGFSVISNILPLEIIVSENSFALDNEEEILSFPNFSFNLSFWLSVIVYVCSFSDGF